MTVNLTVSHLLRMGLRGVSCMHPPGHSDAVTALGISAPPEGLQGRVPLVNVGPGWPITVLRCVEAVAQEGAQQSVLPASCQLSQRPRASCTTRFSALGVHF